jgi:hypothetical protein
VFGKSVRRRARGARISTRRDPREDVRMKYPMLRACGLALLALLAAAGCSSATNGGPDASGNDARDAVAESGSDTSLGDAATRSCHSAAECEAHEDCIFATAGCGVVGVCMAQVDCTRPLAPFCGCDGATFHETCEGAPAPWVSTGACPDGGMVDASTQDAVASDVATQDVIASDAVTQDVVARDAPAADSGGGACGAGIVCGAGLHCCSGGCMNLQNDPLNCGACGHRCEGATPMCRGGACGAAACAPACGAGQSCCDVQGPGPSREPFCVDGPTCPVGCPLCA